MKDAGNAFSPAPASPTDGNGVAYLLGVPVVSPNLVAVSLTAPQVVDHPVSEALPHQRTAFVTASQFPQRMIELTVKGSKVVVVLEQAALAQNVPGEPEPPPGFPPR